MMPTNVAARMTLAADPGSLQGAVAAGILGCGPVILGTSEVCARLLGRRRRASTPARSPRRRSGGGAARCTRAGGRAPGFGHPVHRPVDPRAERILQLADERGVSGTHVALARDAPRSRPRGLGQAADDERLDAHRGGAARSRVPAVGREGDPAARAHRRAARPSGRGAGASDRLPDGGTGRGSDRLRARPDGRIGRADARARGRDASLGRAGRDRRRALPRAARLPLRALGVLPREARRGRHRLGAGGGGLAGIAQLPFTEKDELRASRTPDNPIGTHLCATRAEIVRIYSTSGTTGTPSYIPLTAVDLDNWVTGSARSYAASGVPAGQRIVSTYNAGPFVAGAALASFDRIGLCHIPVGTGNTERLMLAIEQLRPEAAVLTPSYAAYLHRVGRRPRLRPRRLERRAGAGRGRAGRR